MDLNLLTLRDVIRKVGRGVAFYAPDRWDPGLGQPLALEQLGDTEGDLSVAMNTETKGLTTPELSGPAMREVDVMGENPTVDLPLYLADPALLAIVSPTGSAHGGTSRRTSAHERTLVLFPEALFLETVDGISQRREVTFNAGVWLKDGAALTAAEETMLGESMWFWRGFFSRAPRRMRGGGGDDGKNIESITFQSMVHEDMPEGHQLFTTGNPYDVGIDLDGGS